jgi:tetratricopeptide (TPR) repeat protein
MALRNLDRAAQRLIVAGDTDGAAMARRAAEGALGSDPWSWFDLGAILQGAGEAEAAIDAYRTAVQIDPQHIASHQNLAGLLDSEGHFASALLSYRAVLKQQPDRLDYHIAIAETAWRAGRCAEALDLLEASIAGRVNLALCLDLKARLLLQAEQFDTVIALARASWPIVGEDPWALHGMTNAYDSALYAIGRGPEGPISGTYPDLTLERVREAWRRFAAACPSFAAILPVHVIGDSHSTFFTGLNYHQFCSVGAPQMLAPFKAYNIGAKLAHSLDKPGARNPITELLASGRIEHGAAVMLSFGEIDGRVHVLHQARKQDRSVESIQQEIIDTYVATLKRVKSLGFRPAVWAPIGGMPDAHANSHLYPGTGSMVERNRVRRDFIDCLLARCAPDGIPVISIFSAMVGEDLTTDPNWLMDGLHLSQRAMAPTLAAFHAVFQ